MEYVILTIEILQMLGIALLCYSFNKLFLSDRSKATEGTKMGKPKGTIFSTPRGDYIVEDKRKPIYQDEEKLWRMENESGENPN